MHLEAHMHFPLQFARAMLKFQRKSERKLRGDASYGWSLIYFFIFCSFDGLINNMIFVVELSLIGPNYYIDIDSTLIQNWSAERK